MNYQQWLQLAQQLQAQGYTYQNIIMMIGPPPTGQQGLNPSQTAGVGYAGLQAINATRDPYNLQMQAARLGMNPAALISRINQATKPLSAQLTGSVTRAVSPGIAGSGLATAPGMSTQITAEALAPYAQHAQDLAAQTVMGGMGLPFNVGAGLAGQYPQNMVDYALLMGMGQP